MVRSHRKTWNPIAQMLVFALLMGVLAGGIAVAGVMVFAGGPTPAVAPQVTPFPSGK